MVTASSRERFLDGLSGFLAHTFSIILGVGGTLVALPVLFSIIFWLIMWPLSGFVDILTRLSRPEVQSSGDRFWGLWGRAFMALVLYASVGWPLRGVRRAMSKGEDSRRSTKTPHCRICGQFHGDNSRVLTISWPTFWFAVAAVTVGSLISSAVPGIVKDLESILVPVVIPTSRVAVAGALITTGLEWWADSWAKNRPVSHEAPQRAAVNIEEDSR